MPAQPGSRIFVSHASASAAAAKSVEKALEGAGFDVWLDPLDVSALNGLASILIYEFELEAAEFVNGRAIALSEKEGIPHDAARSTTGS